MVKIPALLAFGGATSVIILLLSGGNGDTARKVVPWRRGQAETVHPLLQNVFVAITFNWNVTKLAYLRMSSQAVKQWKTKVDVCVITNGPGRLQRVFDMWQMEEPGRFTLSVCQLARPGGYNKEKEQYGLVWKHREVFERAFKDGAYTTYLYLEDDTDISWPAMTSWAADTEHLEPLGFQRGFYRTEIHPTHGRAVMLDIILRTNLSQWDRLVHLQPPRPCALDALGGDTDRFWAWTEGPAGCAHTDYISLRHPYYGMWIATHAKLARFIDSPYWSKEDALAADLEDPKGGGLSGWGYPERSTGMIQFVDVPEGFWSASVVPYSPEWKMLVPVAHIEHERNGYAGSSAYLSRLPVVKAFKRPELDAAFAARQQRQ